MNRHKGEENVDLTLRLRQIQQLEVPRMVGPRTPADDAIGDKAPLLDVRRHMGRMYVAGHEPHFRPVTLLQQGQEPRSESDPT